MSFKLLTEHYLEFLSLTGDCTDSSESTHVKMQLCWKSHVAVYMYVFFLFFFLFDLILYVPSTIFQLYRDGSSWVEPVLS